MPQDTASRAVLTAFEVVLLGRMRSLGLRVAAEDLAAAEAAMTEIGVAALAHRRIGTLSGGQRQLVFIAQVLAGNPRALLLDISRTRGLTTIAVLHDLNAAARFADRMALLRDGRLVGHGRPADMLTARHLAEVFDVDVAIDAGSDGHPVVLPLRAVVR